MDEMYHGRGRTANGPQTESHLGILIHNGNTLALPGRRRKGLGTESDDPSAHRVPPAKA